MSRVTKLALALAAAVCGIALYDAFTHGLTGHYSVFSDEEPHTIPWLTTLGSIVHGLAYLAFVAVLLRHAASIDAGRRSRTILRWVLVVAYASITLVGTALAVTGRSNGTLGMVATAIFVPMLLVPPALGIVMLVQGDRRPAAYLLAGTLLAWLLVGLLAWIARDWAHPGYVETTVNLGLALLGVPRPAARAVPVMSA